MDNIVRCLTPILFGLMGVTIVCIGIAHPENIEKLGIKEVAIALVATGSTLAVQTKPNQ